MLPHVACPILGFACVFSCAIRVCCTLASQRFAKLSDFELLLHTKHQGCAVMHVIWRGNRGPCSVRSCLRGTPQLPLPDALHTCTPPTASFSIFHGPLPASASVAVLRARGHPVQVDGADLVSFRSFLDILTPGIALPALTPWSDRCAVLAQPPAHWLH